MSAAKRLRQRQAEAYTASPPPASKRIKSTHVPTNPGLDFLVDEEARAGKQLSAKLTNGVARSKVNQVDDSHAVIAQDSSGSEDGEAEEEASVPVKQQPENEIIEISSADDSSELDEDEIATLRGQNGASTNGHGADAEEDAAPADGGAEDLEMEDAENDEPPTFGEQLAARHPETIDLQKTHHDHVRGNGALVHGRDQRIAQPPTAASLGTVLAQALKTNDKDLLESCFAMTDANAIRATIQRQQSQQIAILLTRLAERIHKRPGRAGKLMIWIQWSLVTHGAYLANQPALMKDLKALAHVVRQRANGLQPLLHLKGKLDLLSAQLDARKNMQAASRAANDEDNEDDVLYIEGQERDWSSDDEGNVRRSDKLGKRAMFDLKKVISANDSDDESADDVPHGFINGIENDSSADGEEDEVRDGLLDDEAEEVSDDESSNDDADSNASSMDEDESSEGEDSGVEAVKQPKPQTLNRKR